MSEFGFGKAFRCSARSALATCEQEKARTADAQRDSAGGSTWAPSLGGGLEVIQHTVAVNTAEHIPDT
jgi:hypothetical protein